MRRRTSGRRSTGGAAVKWRARLLPSRDCRRSAARGDPRPPAESLQLADVTDRAEDLPLAAGHVALENLHRTVAVPQVSARFWKQYRAFAGPARLVSVGYMDPGNWATGLDGGASYNSGFLWFVASSGAMAVVL